MEECSAFLPQNVFTDFDKFILTNYDRFYRQFVLFWGTHSTFHRCKGQSVNIDDCSTTIICDGHMKIRRRLCANPHVQQRLAPYFSPIFNNLQVGCPHSPELNSTLCHECMDASIEIPPRKKPLTKKEKTAVQKKIKRAEQPKINDMTTVSSLFRLWHRFRCVNLFISLWIAVSNSAKVENAHSSFESMLDETDTSIYRF